MRVVYNRREPLVNLRDEVFHSMFFNFFTPRIIIGLCALGILTASVFIAPAVTEAVPKKSVAGRGIRLSGGSSAGCDSGHDNEREKRLIWRDESGRRLSYGLVVVTQILGWICWGATCNTADIRNAPNKYGNPDYLNARSVGDATFRTNGPVAQVNVDNTVDGWIKLLSWKDRGWISLSKTSGRSE